MTAGIAIGRERLGVACLAAAAGGWRVQASAEARLDEPLFSGAPSPQAAASLAAALGSVAGNLARRYLPVHVSLPDAAVLWGTFELDQMPKTRAAQLDLVRLRFGRQGLNGAQRYACQPMEDEAGRPLLLGMAADEGWQVLLIEALDRAGIVAWSMSAHASRLFNCFQERFAQASGGLVALAPDGWSLWLWDSRGCPRYARSRWRIAAEDHGEIALEVERSILAYVHGDPRRSVTRLFVAGGGETRKLADALDARLHEPCARLSAEDLGVAPFPGSLDALPCLAAALQR
ncbi:MAG: hypothetical protein WBO23_19870 [Burkholderiales bacterium]